MAEMEQLPAAELVSVPESLSTDSVLEQLGKNRPQAQKVTSRHVSWVRGAFDVGAPRYRK